MPNLMTERQHQLISEALMRAARDGDFRSSMSLQDGEVADLMVELAEMRADTIDVMVGDTVSKANAVKAEALDRIVRAIYDFGGQMSSVLGISIAAIAVMKEAAQVEGLTVRLEDVVTSGRDALLVWAEVESTLKKVISSLDESSNLS